MQQKVFLIDGIYLFCIYFSLNDFNYPNKKLAIPSKLRNSSAEFSQHSFPRKKQNKTLFGFGGRSHFQETESCFQKKQGHLPSLYLFIIKLIIILGEPSQIFGKPSHSFGKPESHFEKTGDEPFLEFLVISRLKFRKPGHIFKRHRVIY